MTTGGPGIRLAPAVRAAELAENIGGALDPRARDARIDWIVAATVATSGCGRSVSAAPEAEANRADRESEPRWLVPILDARHLEACRSDRAGLLLVAAELAHRVEPGKRWVHAYAGWALARVLEQAAGAADREDPTATTTTAPRSPQAAIAEDATIAAGVAVGPGAVVLAGASIGPDSMIEPNAVIYGNVHIGARVRVGAGAVIGRPGFGWARGPGGETRRVPQLGGVFIDDDVEIGPLCTIDAGTLAPTRLGRGVRLDAQVHVAHNVVIGEGVWIAAQSGFAGSVRIEEGVLVGGQVGVADHVVVGRGARLAAKSGVIGDVPPGRTVAGYPAIDRVRWLRALAKLLRGAPR